ncbi:MAG: anaerobic ribonucleoside-triphosphate reductase activating protein [Coriobacteriales bacterium]|nr:anaerobic ribonucleoside-triphosphate reductase activating protein [Coriobacteriales bacterium]
MDAGRPQGGRHRLLIGGITPFSTVDWPGKLACVAFLAGCPWACPYCQNHALRKASAATLGEDDLLGFLGQRRGLLDGVVFSGGEPLVQPAVVQVAQAAKELGFLVGLHTCGAYPERLREILPLADWVGLDIKAPWDKYDDITRTPGAGELARASLEEALRADVELEVRTTWHPDLLSVEDISKIGHAIAEAGVRTWAVQAYRHIGTTGELANRTVYPSDVPGDLPGLFEHYEFRRA